MPRIRLSSVLNVLLAVFIVSCSSASSGEPTEAPSDLPRPAVDLASPKPDERARTAVFAAGCFWCVEAVFKEVNGVTNVISGYAGGTAETATYEKYHQTNHAEVVKITYDPHVVTYGQLLRILFITSEPTVKDKQGPDAGHQYRMAVFYENDEQRKVAEAYIKQLTEAKLYKEPIVTTVEGMPLGFFPAEAYHQDYVAQHPNDAYVKSVSLPRVARFCAKCAPERKPAATQPAEKR